jgi:4'-phosphopantetheinyl transferase
MDAPGWLTQRRADVPSGEEWLGEDERRTLAELTMEPRRAAWCLGRWTVKVAVGAWLGVPPVLVQVLAAGDGAPEAWLDGEHLPLSVSLSHRGDRAMAVVVDAPQAAGCDLEVVEPRSGAFVREWLAPAEQALLEASAETQRPLLANLIWTAKEAAAKVRREGLRLDVRRAVVRPAGRDGPESSWKPLQVDWDDGTEQTVGWWRAEPGWVMTLAAEPAPARPRSLALAG